MILSNRGNKENVNITLNGDNITRITSCKFLGVNIDETLKFDVHPSKLCTKVLQSMVVSRRVSNMAPLTASAMLLYIHAMIFTVHCSYFTGSMILKNLCLVLRLYQIKHSFLARTFGVYIFFK